MNDIDRWLTVEGARGVVGVSRRTIYNWIKNGKLETKRTIGGSLRIKESSLWEARPASATAVSSEPLGAWVETVKA